MTSFIRKLFGKTKQSSKETTSTTSASGNQETNKRTPITNMVGVTSNKVNLTRLSYVSYCHQDLAKFRKFASDFGFVEALASDDEIIFQGYSQDPILYIATKGAESKFKGCGFAAKSEADFDRACNIQGAQIQDTSKRPGGGRLVSITDPNGYTIDVLWGQTEQTVPARAVSSWVGEPAASNGAIDKQRKGEFKRFKKGPAMINKLGHFGYHCDTYDEIEAWYTTHFNLTPQDILYSPQDESLIVATFYKLDLGPTYVDHHCFLLVREPPGKGTRVHHSSFEVEDFDTQLLGHYWLEQNGYSKLWGVGRHVHGSQLFDYWKDTSDFTIEHFADGDLVNSDTPICRAAAGNMAVWGPEAGPEIFDH